MKVRDSDSHRSIQNESKGAIVAKSKSKAKTDRDLYDRLRVGGVRKKVAKEVSRLRPDKDSAEMNAVRRVANDLNKAAEDVKDLVTGGPQKRSKAAKKGAKTRKKNKAAKKGAKKEKKSKKS